MSVATYGVHAESAARALNWLLRQDAAPVASEAVEQLLHCREAVVDALRQRLYGFGLDASVRVDELTAPAPGVNLEGIDFKLATLLDNIATAAPRLPVEERLAPSEILSRQTSDPVTEAWRVAAIEMLSASHALDLASDKPWLHDPGAGWHLIRDAAVAIEAVLVLDERLAEVGLLNQHDALRYPLELEEKRLIASQAARVATWYASSDAPDHATPRPPDAPRGTVIYPVAMVTAPEDLAAGQQRLAAFMRPMTTQNASYTGEPEISSDSARQVAASQLHLCRVFGAMARSHPATETLARFFDDRAEVLASLQPQLRFLVDIASAEPNRRRFWQQIELTTAITRIRDRGIHLRLQPVQMLSLATATHEVTNNLGLCLRRELLRATSNLHNADPRREDGPVRVGRNSALEVTLTDLVHMPAPNIPVATYSIPLQRAALRQTLDITPTARRPPAPYPAASRPGGNHYSR